MKRDVKFEFQGTAYNLQVERDGNSLTIYKDGTAYAVRLLDGAGAQAAPAAAAAPAPAPAAAQPAPAASNPAPAAPAAPAPAGNGGGEAEKAPITGTVKEVKVAKGAAVNAGDLVLIMEAMKMEIEVFANSGGTVQDIFVNPGDSVQEGNPLLSIG